MKAFRLLLLAAACTLPALAAAQWQWIDKDGRKVFSDQSPPPDIPAKNILKQPGGRAAPPPPMAATGEAMAAAPASAPAAAKSSASAPQLSGKDKALEDKRKQAEAAEAEKKKAEEDKIAVARAENCKRARQGKLAFDSGQRIAMTDDKGERYFLDDKQRASETKRLEGLIARDCGPNAQ
ncbi:MAG: DUF4124 domain-containing protein [Pseudomonadota bacterium]